MKLVPTGTLVFIKKDSVVSSIVTELGIERALNHDVGEVYDSGEDSIYEEGEIVMYHRPSSANEVIGMSGEEFIMVDSKMIIAVLDPEEEAEDREF